MDLLSTRATRIVRYSFCGRTLGAGGSVGGGATLPPGMYLPLPHGSDPGSSGA
jgi:hypothetical protein